MKDASIDETVIETLETALASGSLPDAAKEHAKHLLKRLASPVRVSVLGQPGSGKSELINMFIGRRLLPRDAELPTTEIVYGDADRMIITHASGKVESLDKIDFGARKLDGAAFLRLETNATILKRISFMEIVTDGSVAEMSSAVDWSVRRTDIALWCTQAFDESEQVIWHRTPDGLKDHAFLVLTKADVLSEENVLSGRVASLQTIVAEEFHSLFAIATLQAIKAHRGEGVVDEAMYHASGGGALTSEVLRHAERGRRADFDGAHMFLARYKIPAIVSKTKATPIETAALDVPVQPGECEATQEVPADAFLPENLSVSDPERPPALVVAPEEKPENLTLLSDAVRYLKRRGEKLTQTAETLGEGNAKDLIETCVDAVEHLVDLFSHDDSGCAVADAFIDELSEASDMMILMQTEEGDAPAADAVTLLLQLRRDMEMKLAA